MANAFKSINLPATGNCLGKIHETENTLSTQLVCAAWRNFCAERRKKLVYQMMPQAALTQKAAVSFRHSQLRRLTCQTALRSLNVPCDGND